mgnify:CR=1 FL=1
MQKRLKSQDESDQREKGRNTRSPNPHKKSYDVTLAFKMYDFHASYWTNLKSQLGQVVVLSKPYYIHFLSYTDVPDFEAYHKYSQVYLIISRQW